MIERKFWEEVRSHWILEAPPQISDRKTSSGGEIDPSLLEDPWGQEGIPFDMVDYDDASLCRSHSLRQLSRRKNDKNLCLTAQALKNGWNVGRSQIISRQENCF